MPEMTFLSADQLADGEDLFSQLNQEKIETLLEQITNLIEDRLDRFHTEFEKRFNGYSPEFFSDLIYLQKINVKNYF